MPKRGGGGSDGSHFLRGEAGCGGVLRGLWDEGVYEGADSQREEEECDGSEELVHGKGVR